MKEPRYLTIARSYIGLKEIVGVKTAPTITNWLIRLNAWWRDDETPWCGVFVGACLQEALLPYPKLYMRAKAWLEYGERLEKPCLGCIVIFDRKGGGHVGFAIGKDRLGRLLILGGNQGNQVSVMPFDTTRVLGYRMPFGFSTSTLLPIISNESASSESES
jgi:uncharacterized protein (TIGR02594 family)